MPSPITIYDDLTTWTGTTESTGWKQPSNVGDSGGPDPSKTPGVFAMTPGETATFSAHPAYPYNNGYWYMKWRAAQTVSSFLYDFWVQFPAAADLAACQALEFELQQSAGNYVYNMAWQVHPSAATPWRYFDKVKRQWIASATPNDPTVWQNAQWVRLAATYTRNSDQTVTHVALCVNGQWLPVGVTQPAQPVTGPDYLAVAFQLDTVKAMTPYKVAVQRMRVTTCG